MDLNTNLINHLRCYLKDSKSLQAHRVNIIEWLGYLRSWSPPLPQSWWHNKPSSVLFYGCTHAENVKRVKKLVCSRNFLPTHHLQWWVTTSFSFPPPGYLITGRVFCISLAPGSVSVLPVQCSVSLFSLANSVWILRILNEGVWRLMVASGREGVELWQHWQNMTRLRAGAGASSEAARAVNDRGKDGSGHLSPGRF